MLGADSDGTAKADPPFDFAQGRLSGDDEQDSKTKCGGLSTQRWTMMLSITPVEMTLQGRFAA
jgi:hypothetical protein